jgi:hypothetical protein
MENQEDDVGEETKVEEECEAKGKEGTSKSVPCLVEEDSSRDDDADISKFLLGDEGVCEFRAPF